MFRPSTTIIGPKAWDFFLSTYFILMLVKNSKCNTLIDLPWNQIKFDAILLKIGSKRPRKTIPNN